MFEWGEGCHQLIGEGDLCSIIDTVEDMLHWGIGGRDSVTFVSGEENLSTFGDRDPDALPSAVAHCAQVRSGMDTEGTR